MEMVGKRLNHYCNALISSCEAKKEPWKPSLIASSTADDILPNICAISIYCTILSNLSKTALGNNMAMKTAVLKFWTTEGCHLLASCHHIQRCVKAADLADI